MSETAKSMSAVPPGKQAVVSIYLRLGLTVLFAVLAAVTRYLDAAAISFGRVSDSVSVSGFLFWVFVSAAVFEVAVP